MTRLVESQDIDALYRLMTNVYASSNFMSQEFCERYPDRRALEAQLADSICLVAQEAQELLGYVFITANKPAKLRHTADLNMGVDKDAHGRGVGRRLLENSIAVVRETGGIEILYLHVRTDNTRAVALYERFGFERLCVLTRDTKIGDTYYDAALMRKIIG